MPSRMSPTVLCNPPPSVNTPASLVRLTVGRQDGSTALWPPDGTDIRLQGEPHNRVRVAV